MIAVRAIACYFYLVGVCLLLSACADDNKLVNGRLYESCDSSVPVAGATLQLFLSGSNCSFQTLLATATTDTDGTFIFEHDAPDNQEMLIVLQGVALGQDTVLHAEIPTTLDSYALGIIRRRTLTDVEVTLDVTGTYSDTDTLYLPGIDTLVGPFTDGQLVDSIFDFRTVGTEAFSECYFYPLTYRLSGEEEVLRRYQVAGCSEVTRVEVPL